MERIAILGGNSLIGQHLILALTTLNNNNKALNVWELEEAVEVRIADNNNLDSLNVNSFVGLDALDNVLHGCDIVFNLHEIQDFSLIPDKNTMNAQNTDFVETLLGKCKTNGISKLVHLSSVYLQCSARWPNIFGRESEDYCKFQSEVPFPAYCETKTKAEQIIQLAADKIQSVLARVGPVYGEGDRCSLICDSILLSQQLPLLPRIGDQKGVLQFAYAGNVAYALLKCANKLFEIDSESDDRMPNSQRSSEVVLIQDNTPVCNFYDLMLKPLYNDCNRSLDNRTPAAIAERSISFYIFFPLYCLLCLFGWTLQKGLGISTRLAKIPSPYYLYLVFHHWTFFSDFKLRIFFDYLPQFDYETSQQRSLDYYLQLKPDQITKFSWMPQ